ncbi:hypothetical protein CBL_20851 [Carabus blaptoides fortunei]
MDNEMDTEQGWRLQENRHKRARSYASNENISFHSITNSPPRPSSHTSSGTNHVFTSRRQVPLFTTIVSNLPAHLRTPRSLAPYIRQIRAIKIVNVLSTRAGNIIIKSTDKNSTNHLQILTHLIKDSNIIIQPERTNQSPNNNQKSPSFSCVITNVDHDVTMDEIKEQLHQDGHNIKNLWRIKSRAHDKDTRLIRIVTTSQHTLDHLLANGFTLFYQHHRVEASHAPKPQPIQCHRCQEFHAPDACKKPIRCPRCSKPHHLQQCDATENDIKCANCRQQHPSFSHKCPARPKEPVSAATTAPLKCLDPPAEDDSPLATTHDVLRFVTIALLNSAPTQRWCHILEQMFTSAAAQSAILSDHTQQRYSLTKMSNTFNIGTINVASYRAKRQLIENLLTEENISVLAITETRSLTIKASGYRAHCRACEPHRGGVAILVHSSIYSQQLSLPTEFHALHTIAVTINTRKGPVNIFCIYLHPRSALPFNLLAYAYQLPLFRIEQNLPTFIGHQGHSNIDHILITEDIARFTDNSAYIGPCVASDHLPVIVKTHLHAPPPTRPTGRIIRDVKAANWDLFATTITNSLDRHNEHLNSAERIEQSVDNLTRVIREAADAAIPLKTIYFDRRPLPPALVQLIKEKRRLYRQYNRTHDPHIKRYWNELNAIIRRRVVQMSHRTATKQKPPPPSGSYSRDKRERKSGSICQSHERDTPTAPRSEI